MVWTVEPVLEAGITSALRRGGREAGSVRNFCLSSSRQVQDEGNTEVSLRIQQTEGDTECCLEQIKQ